MKIFKTFRIIIAFIVIGMAVLSCSKPEDGKDGKDGNVGTANVIYSDWITVNGTQTEGSWAGMIPAPKITQEIMDKGVILVFNKYFDSIYPLPYSSTNEANEIIFTTPIINLSQIFVVANYDAFSKQDTYRYVIIPGGVSSGANRMINSSNNIIDYKKMSYQEICLAFDIPL
jgi:hypothetical protein